MLNRGAVKDTRLDAKAKDTKNPTPRTALPRTDPLEIKDVGANVLEKKGPKFFSGHLQLRKTIKVFPNFPRGFWRFPTKFQRFKK